MPPTSTRRGIPAQLSIALDAVSSALSLLRRDPRAPAVAEAMRRALAAVDGLDVSVTAIMLRRVLASAEECHQEGVRSSIALSMRTRAASRALRLDPTLEPRLSA